MAALDVPNLAPNMRDGAIAYLRERWTWRSPEVESGIKLMQEVGENMAPGFVQLQRDDSLLHFTQQNAVMLASGSWEADTVFSQCSFPLVSFPIPLPLPTDQRFGANVLGPISELAIPPGNAVGVSKSSLHPDLAVDFLRFLTSKPVSEKIMKSSRRLSCIVGVAPSKEMAVFQVQEDGYPSGFPVEFSEGFNEAIRVYRTQLYALYGPQGSPSRFIKAMEENFPRAMKKDLANMARDAAKISRKEDGTIVRMSREPATKPEDQSLLLESQTLRELDAAQTLYLLANPGK
jgi:ABC-type glycerol-3-phosphate transport system substrate-binding protein